MKSIKTIEKIKELMYKYQLELDKLNGKIGGYVMTSGEMTLNRENVNNVWRYNLWKCDWPTVLNKGDASAKISIFTKKNPGITLSLVPYNQWLKSEIDIFKKDIKEYEEEYEEENEIEEYDGGVKDDIIKNIKEIHKLTVLDCPNNWDNCINCRYSNGIIDNKLECIWKRG